jgi:hypothetical protein
LVSFVTRGAGAAGASFSHEDAMALGLAKVPACAMVARAPMRIDRTHPQKTIKNDQNDQE